MNETLKRTTFIPMKQVNIDDDFWNRYISLVKDVVLPYQWDAINDNVTGAEKSHAVQNLKISAGLDEGQFYGFIFQDTDTYKWIEAVGYLLAKTKHEQLEQYADQLIDIIALAQQPDGYLNSYYTIKEPNGRWTNLTEAHELYCAGHLIEAAVAYYKATNKRKLLDVACLFADCIDRTFGFESGKIEGFDGHQEIELALIKLYEVTGENRYLSLSKFFIDVRGTNNFMYEEAEKRGWTSIWTKDKINIDPAYFQAHAPVRDQNEAHGHAVRVMYMLSGMIDIALETRDVSLIEASKTLWRNIVNKQMYITGGIGSTVHGEAFTFNYDLPNDTAYAETCASIGLIFAGKRLLQYEPHHQYSDIMERALYNTVLSGMALDGKHFFYVNPLEVFPDQCHGHNRNYNHIKTTRPEWYGCACCPPNLARLLTSLGDYVYSIEDDTIYIHLFIGSNAHINLNKKDIYLIQKSSYLRDGRVNFQIKGTFGDRLTLAIRQPSWSKVSKIVINGELELKTIIHQNGYLHLSREWQDGDNVEVQFDMQVQRVKAHPSIRQNVGKVALQRGPLVYCLEQADNGKQLHTVSLPADAIITELDEHHSLEGLITLTATGSKLITNKWEDSTLYQEERSLSAIDHKLTFIPYFTWANRGEGEMLVWVKET